jgi:PLP dependent protein
VTVEGLADPATIRTRATEIRDRLRAAGDAGDRVTLIAVTKGFPPQLAANAVAAGLVDLGENYAQELVDKAHLLAGADATPVAGVRWHFIGGLQSNKIKVLAGTVSLWHTVDRSSLADGIARRDPGAAVLVQVNTTAEPQKSGCEPGVAPALVDHARSLGLAVRGLMTIGPTSPADDPRPCFVRLRQLAEVCEVDELSMGMSSDYELAVREGSTMVRIGSALFGQRPGRGEPPPGRSNVGD